MTVAIEIPAEALQNIKATGFEMTGNGANNLNADEMAFLNTSIDQLNQFAGRSREQTQEMFANLASNVGVNRTDLNMTDVNGPAQGGGGMDVGTRSV